jgi:hypothetical protein
MMNQSNTMLVLLIVLTATLLTACSTVNTPTALPNQNTTATTIRIATQDDAPTQRPGQLRISDTEVSYAVEDMTLIVSKPEAWDAIDRTNGVVISEQFASVETAGALEGLMATTFFTRSADLSVDVSGEEQPAHAVLDSISRNASTRRIANRTAVVSFEWDGYDAAYYMLSDTEDVSSFIVSVWIPEIDGGVLLSSIISAPYAAREEIAGLLPSLMDHLRLNDVTLSADPFEAIAADVEFPPAPDADMVSTLQATLIPTVETTVEATAAP